MGLTVITPALTECVTLEECRRQCRIHASDTTYDGELQGYLDAAVSHVGTIIDMALEPTTYRYTLDAFDGDISLPIGPVVSIDSVKHYIDDVLTTIDDADYSLRQLSDMRSEIVPASAWPATDTGVDRVQVEFTAGFEGELDSATYTPAVPAAIRQAVLLLVGHWWRNRSAVEMVSSGDLVSVPLAFDALVQPYKRLIIA